MHLQQAFSCWDNEHCAANKTAQPCSMCLPSVQNTQLNWARNSSFPYSHGTNDSCRWLRRTSRGAKLKAEFWGFLFEGFLWRCCAVAGGCFSGPRGSPCTGAVSPKCCVWSLAPAAAWVRPVIPGNAPPASLWEIQSSWHPGTTAPIQKVNIKYRGLFLIRICH